AESGARRTETGTAAAEVDVAAVRRFDVDGCWRGSGNPLREMLEHRQFGAGECRLRCLSFATYNSCIELMGESAGTSQALELGECASVIAVKVRDDDLMDVRQLGADFVKRMLDQLEPAGDAGVDEG